MINPNIFKSYDVRGVYPEEINEEIAYAIGRAFVEFMKVKQVAVGYDMRKSTPSMLPHLYAGISDAGAGIVNLGMIGTEMMYFSVGEFKYESGIMITASHNPPQYNGMKFVGAGAKPVGSDTGLYAIRDMAVNSNYERKNVIPKITNKNSAVEFKAKINSLVDLANLKPMKIVVDAGNGMGGYLFNTVFANTALQVVPMYFEPDGNFPNHIPDPMKPENIDMLAKRVLSENADLGIALDGDSDRCVFIDEHGNFSMGYYLVAIISKMMLIKYPHAKIVHENRLQWAIIDKVAEAGGTAVPSMAGHSHLKAKMREIDAVFAGETSSHFYYKDMHYTDSSALTIALIIEMLQKENKTLSQVLEEYRNKYFTSNEINYSVSDAQKVLDAVEAKYTAEGYDIDKIDGVAFDNDRIWHFSVRKSNTEPVVRLNVEAKDQETVNRMVSEVEGIIKS